MPDSENPWDSLTKKQQEALDLIARGHSQRQAAAALGISRRSLRDRLGGISPKLTSVPDWLYRWKHLRHTAQIR